MSNAERLQIEERLNLLREILKREQMTTLMLRTPDQYKHVGQIEGKIIALEWVLRSLKSESTPPTS